MALEPWALMAAFILWLLVVAERPDGPMIGSNLNPRGAIHGQVGPVIWSHRCMLPHNFLGEKPDLKALAQSKSRF